MEDYTKFRLKEDDKLIPLLENEDNIFAVSCNKCFKEFSAEGEPEPGEFAALLDRLEKKLSGCVSVDFLCNEIRLAKTLEAEIPTDADSIFVISCGLGVQAVANCATVPVFAASDSMSFIGRHGMSLTKLRCGACAQCYLNYTGGVCPVTNCSKSLFNGPCGGSKNFKCEADRNKDCAWTNVYTRLKAQNRIADLLSLPVQFHDYSKVNFKSTNDYVKAVREKRLSGFYGGLHPSEHKELSENLAFAVFPAPKTLVIPLLQHKGVPARPIVKVGETVKAGQKIGEAAGLISCNIHSGVSGTVAAIELRPHPVTDTEVLSVVIDSDGKDDLHESVRPYGDLDSLSADDIVDILREKGIAGMGGAVYPTSAKLKSANPMIDTVLLNGCECEPMLTADHRIMLEYADDIVFALKAIIKATAAEKGMIVIEDNKINAIELLESKTTDIENISIVSVKTKYPQGAERMLVRRALGRNVPHGALPIDVGVVVCNVSTAKSISDAVKKGMPLIERPVTVTGKMIKHPGNFLVKIGVSVRDIIEYCGGFADDNDDNITVKLGGPMMGNEIKNFDVPIVKSISGIIALPLDVSKPSECIRCGRCVDVCPMELLPLYFPGYAGRSDWKKMDEKSVRDCIECGCCDFICSAKIQIRRAIKIGKKALGTGGK